MTFSAHHRRRSGWTLPRPSTITDDAGNSTVALYHQNTTLLYPNHRITSFSARAKSNAPPTPHGPRGDPSNPRSISFTLLDTNASCARCLASRVCSTVVAIDDSVASSALGSPATAGACACIDPPGSSRCRNACRKTAAARFLFSARTARLRAFSERVVLGLSLIHI